MSCAICFNLDQSKILLSGNGLTSSPSVKYMFELFTEKEEVNPFPNDKI